MSVSDFDAFKIELMAIKTAISGFTQKTIRDEALISRIQALFRTWVSVIRPTIEPIFQNKKQLLKLHAEIEALAKLTAKYKPTIEYRKHLNRSIMFANNIIPYLPLPKLDEDKQARTAEQLFIRGIPDLSVKLVPNSLFGWKNRLESFVNKHPFDKSVFIMIRYRKRNEKVVKIIKNTLKKYNLYGVLASEQKLTDDLYNPVACLLCCSKGIVVFDKAEVAQAFNPNVAYELGMLHLLGRDCLILKHDTLEVLHSDILMKLYQGYKTIRQIEEHVKNWLDKNKTEDVE
jgi:hypothetical protein